HHERYDERGYPNGTVGRRLLLIAQVIPVADSLDAMTTARAYRGAKSWDTAMDELRRGAGTQWNPHVVEAALAGLDDWGHDHRRRAVGGARLPHRADESVHQHRTLRHTVAAEHPEVLAVGHDPR